MRRMKNFYRKFSNLSIRNKLFFIFLLLIAFPIFLFLLVNSLISSREGEKQALYTASQVLAQTKSFLESKTESAKNSLVFLSLNDTVQKIVNRKASEYKNNIGLWSVDALELEKVFFAVKNNTDIKKIHIYMNEGPAAILQSESIISIREHITSKWYNTLITKNRQFQWYGEDTFPSPDDMDYIYAVRKITSINNIHEYIGAVRVDIPKVIFEEILNKITFTESTTSVLVNSDDQIICSSENFSMPPDMFFEIISGIPETEDNQEYWNTITVNHEKMLVGMESIKNSDWRIFLLVPYKDILRMNNKSRQQMIFIFLLIAPLTLPLAYIISSTATRRIKVLMDHMQSVNTGDFNIPILNPESQDEIGQLTRHFNYMLTKISMLIDEKFELGKKIKNIELKALQAQINPHFLYNTLDLINWMSKRKNAPEISVLVLTLAKYYKLSLSSGKDMVTIQNEIEHIEAYVQIQNMRFENHISLEISVPEEIRNYLIPKLVFQPLVENAIMHGIMQTDDETGYVRISACTENEDIYIYIEDNGAGMEPEKLDTILQDKNSHEHHGYGVRNIHERIQLTYGSDYGLSFESTPGKGTIVTIKIHK